jgi:co-chaperonin GroES (HSP10)
MKAIGKNLIIKKQKEGTTKTKGGLLLAESSPRGHSLHRSCISFRRR